jgi:hypothetical protein
MTTGTETGGMEKTNIRFQLHLMSIKIGMMTTDRMITGRIIRMPGRITGNRPIKKAGRMGPPFFYFCEGVFWGNLSC